MALEVLDESQQPLCLHRLVGCTYDELASARASGAKLGIRTVSIDVTHVAKQVELRGRIGVEGVDAVLADDDWLRAVGDEAMPLEGGEVLAGVCPSPRIEALDR